MSLCQFVLAGHSGLGQIKRLLTMASAAVSEMLLRAWRASARTGIFLGGQYTPVACQFVHFGLLSSSMVRISLFSLLQFFAKSVGSKNVDNQLTYRVVGLSARVAINQRVDS